MNNKNEQKRSSKWKRISREAFRRLNPMKWKDYLKYQVPKMMSVFAVWNGLPPIGNLVDTLSIPIPQERQLIIREYLPLPTPLISSDLSNNLPTKTNGSKPPLTIQMGDGYKIQINLEPSGPVAKLIDKNYRLPTKMKTLPRPTPVPKQKGLWNRFSNIFRKFF